MTKKTKSQNTQETQDSITHNIDSPLLLAKVIQQDGGAKKKRISGKRKLSTPNLSIMSQDSNSSYSYKRTRDQETGLTISPSSGGYSPQSQDELTQNSQEDLMHNTQSTQNIQNIQDTQNYNFTEQMAGASPSSVTQTENKMMSSLFGPNRNNAKTFVQHQQLMQNSKSGGQIQSLEKLNSSNYAGPVPEHLLNQVPDINNVGQEQEMPQQVMQQQMQQQMQQAAGLDQYSINLQDTVNNNQDNTNTNTNSSILKLDTQSLLDTQMTQMSQPSQMSQQSQLGGKKRSHKKSKKRSHKNNSNSNSSKNSKFFFLINRGGCQATPK